MLETIDAQNFAKTYLPNNAIDAAMRGCVRSIYDGTLEADRPMWVNVFKAMGASEEEADMAIDQVCKPIAEDLKKGKAV
ncbi:MAG: hypothetical protein ABW189_01545 [Rickettsiales bacterium]